MSISNVPFTVNGPAKSPKAPMAPKFQPMVPPTAPKKQPTVLPKAVTNPKNSKPLKTDDPKKSPKDQDPKKQIEQLKKDNTVVQKYQKKIEDTAKKIEDAQAKIDKSLKSATEARQICLLRLDMLADKLEKISPRMAFEIDRITNHIEKSDWE